MTKDKKRIAIVTGASSGFGRIFAVELEKSIDLEEIWLVARREDKLKETASLLERVKGIVIKADISDMDEVRKLAMKADSENVSVRVLVNNAGFGRSEEFVKGEDEYYEKMLDVNAKAPVILTKSLIRYMDEGASILNISSSAAFAPMPFFAVYAATKAFLLSFSYALNYELAEKHISVTCVCPGPASTEFFKTKLKKVNGLRIEDPEKIVAKALKDMKDKKSVSVYSWRMNFLRIISKFLPRNLLTRGAGKVKMPK